MILIESSDMSRDNSSHSIVVIQPISQTRSTTKFGWDSFPIVGRNYSCYSQQQQQNECFHSTVDDDFFYDCYNETKFRNTSSETVNTKNANGKNYYNDINHDSFVRQKPTSIATCTIHHPAIVVSFDTFGWNDFPIISCSTINTDTYAPFLDTHMEDVNRNIRNTMFAQNTNFIIPCEQQKQKKKKKQVRFSSDKNELEQVRYYNITLGDHPLCESYPITFGWKYYNENDDVGDEDDYIKGSDKDEKALQNRIHIDLFYNCDSTSSLLINPIRNGISSSPHCRRIMVQERRHRLAHSMGLNFDQLDNLESIRFLSLMYEVR